MKKFLVIAAAALALAACSKSEVFAPKTSPIDFAPNAMSTKALVEGTVFPDESFGVFAYADLENGNGIDYANPVMDNVEIKKQGPDWKGVTTTAHPDPYMWTPTGFINFYAYYPLSLDASFVATENQQQSNKGLHLDNVDLGVTINSQIDPMVACALQQQSSLKPQVPMVFKHITSQIQVYAFDATTIESLRGHIIVQKVTFKQMKRAGSYVEGEVTGNGTWTPVADYQEFVPYQTTSPTVLPKEKDSENKPVEKNLSENSLFVVIPTHLAATDNTAIEVTYMTTAYDINGFHYPDSEPKTATIPLFDAQNPRITDNAFKNGKRYIFHLGITLDKANNEIMFSPSVEDWSTEDVNGLTIDAVNAILL